LLTRFGNEEIKAVSNIIKKISYLSGFTNKYLGGEEIQKFEKEFAKFHGCKYGISVNSGTSALFVAQKAVNVNSKSNVAIPCISFTSTTSQVLACNATPIFFDIDKDSYCMNFEPNQQRCNFAIPVHLLGHPCNFDMINNMKEKRIFVIEDCAQAAGAHFKKKMVGSIGDCGIFSFQETKHITTLGEGGMIITNNEEFARKCKNIRNHGEYYKNDKTIGFNFRMTEAQAAFGRVQLRKLPKMLEIFKKNVQYICKNLPEQIIPPFVPKDFYHSYFILGCKFNEKKAKISRTKFIKKLTENRKKFLKSEPKSDIKGINFRPGKIISEGYKTTQYKIPLYKKFAPKKKCTVGEEFVKKSIFLDIHRWRTKSEIKDELDILKKTFP